MPQRFVSSDTKHLGTIIDRNGRKGSVGLEPSERWSAQDARELYDVASWGKGYFSVNDEGHVLVHPDKNPARAIDLKQLVDTLVLRGISLLVQCQRQLVGNDA